jgi:hypothetical protein
MDQSDILRKKQAQTIYTYYRQTILSQQANCNYSTCSSITNCIVNYPSYEERQQVNIGSQECNSCSQKGCGCK